MRPTRKGHSPLQRPIKLDPKARDALAPSPRRHRSGPIPLPPSPPRIERQLRCAEFRTFFPIVLKCRYTQLSKPDCGSSSTAAPKSVLVLPMASLEESVKRATPTSSRSRCTNRAADSLLLSRDLHERIKQVGSTLASSLSFLTSFPHRLGNLVFVELIYKTKGGKVNGERKGRVTKASSKPLVPFMPHRYF